MMSMRITTGKLFTLTIVAAALTVGVAGLAQQPPGGGGGGGRRQGGFGGRGGGQVTLATVPVAVLADGLHLTAGQTSKIQGIQDQYRKDATALRPQQGEQVDRNELMQKMGALQEETTKSIQGVLNETQTKAAPAFIKSISGYRMVGIPLEVLPELKLTSSQKSQITTIAEGAQKQMADARAAAQAANGGQPGGGQGGPGGGGFQQFQEMMKANSDKAAAVLTSTQKATLAKYVADHPQRGFGGGGRRGGGGGQGGGNGPV
jgi:hypothetical protein